MDIPGETNRPPKSGRKCLLEIAQGRINRVLDFDAPIDNFKDFS